MSGTERYVPGESADPAKDPWLSSVVGQRYRIEARIGQGGMGVIYRGQHLELGKRVAIKRLDARISSDPISFERFRREAIAASRIESPHVVHVFDWGKADDGSPYLVMELLEGSDLRQLLMQEGRLLVEQAASIVAQVLRALIHTHQARIIHRDLKPENVFLCRYDDEVYVKLLDFGISKRSDAEADTPQVTRTGVVLGTASYMSPEQARGDETLDLRSDLYSVGAILYETLSGRVPHRGRTYEATLYEICTRDADDVRLHAPLVPESLAKVVARALARDPNRRFESAKEFLEALGAAVPSVGLLSLDSGANKSLGSRVPESVVHSDMTSSVRFDATETHATERTRRHWWKYGSAVLGVVMAAWLAVSVRPRAAEVPPPFATASVSQGPPATRASSSMLPASVDHATTAASSTEAQAISQGGNGSAHSPSGSGRAALNRVSSVPHQSSVPDNGSSGVLPGLKLRRTMH